MKPIILKPTLSTHFILGFTLGFGFVILLFIFVGFVRGIELVFNPLILMMVWFFLVQLWIFAFKIEISANELRFRKLFGGWTVIKREEIQEGNFNVGFRGFGRPFYSLIIIAKPNLGKSSIEINLKPFGFTQSKLIEKWLCEKATGELRKSLFKKNK